MNNIVNVNNNNIIHKSFPFPLFPFFPFLFSPSFSFLKINCSHEQLMGVNQQHTNIANFRLRVF